MFKFAILNTSLTLKLALGVAILLCVVVLMMCFVNTLLSGPAPMMSFFLNFVMYTEVAIIHKMIYSNLVIKHLDSI
jgi:hypothetical protein